MRRIIGCSGIAVAFLVSSAAAQDPPPDETPTFDPATAPLFASHDLLELTLQGPLGTVFRERDQESEEFPAVISYVDASGDTVRLDLEISTRGRFRLQRRTCRFPPLEVDFPRSRTVGTVFAGQNDLKLVTHCQDRDDYEQYVLQEYLVYRMFNIFTDMSFRVRLAHITYVDTDEDVDTVSKYAFFIEYKDDVAARNGSEVIELPRVAPDFFDQTALNTVELFQYMIGNTDFSAFAAPAGEDECCHNAKVMGLASGPVYSVPYDFDMAGIIQTRYARPDERLGIRNVRQRRYRGICHTPEDLQAAITQFNVHRDSIYSLYRSESRLDPDELEDTLEYLDQFYETINDERRLRREILETCRM